MPGRSRSSQTSSDSAVAAPAHRVPVGGSNLERLQAMIRTHELEETHASEDDGSILQAFFDLTEQERKAFADDGNIERLGEVVSADVEQLAEATAKEEAASQAVRVEAWMGHAKTRAALEGQLAPHVAPMISVALAERFQTARFPAEGEAIELRDMPAMALSIEVVFREDTEALVAAGVGLQVRMDAITVGAELTTTRAAQELFGIVADYGGQVRVPFDLHLTAPDGSYAFATPTLVYDLAASGLALGAYSTPQLDVDFRHLDLSGAW